MTKLAASLENLRTHIAAVQIGGSDVFPGVFPTGHPMDGEPSSVLVSSEDHKVDVLRRPCVLITHSDARAHEEHGNALQYVTVYARLEVDIAAGRTGKAAPFGGWGKSGIEQIRQAIIAATDSIGPQDSPAIAPGLTLIDGDAPVKQERGLYVTTLTYELFCEVGA